MLQKSKLSLFNQSKTYFSASSSSSTSYSDDFHLSSDESDEDPKKSSFNMSYVLVVDECNPINHLLENESYCFDERWFANKLIKGTYIEAINLLKPKPKIITVFDIVGPIIEQIVDSIVPCDAAPETTPDLWFYKSDGCDISSNEDIEWPKISEFNIKLGLEKVEDYVSTWEGLQNWLFCIEFLGFECEDCSNVFVYEVEWSKPTKSYPIPQVTASVYFALEVYKMVPYKNDRSINVTYIFEASSVIHVPGRIDFQEKWLEDILDAKIKIFKKFVFSTLPSTFECDIKRTNLMRRISEIFDTD